MRIRSIIILMLISLVSGGLSPLHRPGPAWAQSNEEELFFVAQKAFDDGFYDVAIRYIEQFLQKFPQTDKRIQARLLLGQCYFFQSQYLQAFEVFQDLLKYSEFKDATLFWLGETHFKAADYIQAEKYYQQLLDVYPDSAYKPQGYYSLGWTYFEQAKYEKAQKTFTRLMKEFPAHQLSEDAAFKIAESEHTLGNYETAIEYFNAYILKYPNSPRHADAYFYVGEAFYYQENFLNAITYYAKAAALAYDQKLAYMAKVSMGWSYLKLEKFDLAERFFAEAHALADEKGLLTDDIYLGEATLYAQKGEHQKASDSYQKLINEFPNSPRIAEARLGKANMDYALSDYSSALQNYQWIIDQYSKSEGRKELLEKAYYGTAWTYLKSGNIDLSIKTFEKIINTSTSKVVKVSALTQIGDAYHDIEDFERSIETYDRILKDFPDSLYTDYVQFRLGIALLKMGRTESATLSFQTLQSNFPHSKYINDSQYYLGVASFKKQDWAKAINYIDQYLTSSKSGLFFESESHYILGTSYFNLKKYEPALKNFEMIIHRFPNDPTSLRAAEINIAKCLFELGDVKGAIKKFDYVAQTYPNTEVALDGLFWLADYYLNSGDYQQAVKRYNEIVSLYPENPRHYMALYEIGQAYERLDRIDEALNAYKRVDQPGQKEIYTKAHLAIADIFKKELDPSVAIETYRNIIENVPEFRRDALVNLAKMQINNKKIEAGLSAYQSALEIDKGLSQITDAEIQFHIGDTYELLGNEGTAMEYYFKIPYLYPKEKIWVIKAYLRIARIFENQEDWGEAKNIYTKVIEFGTDESKYAQERIDWINDNS